VTEAERAIACPGCGYDLRGLAERGRCPECGEAYEPRPSTEEGDPDAPAPIAVIGRRAIDRLRWGLALVLWWLVLVLPLSAVAGLFDVGELRFVCSLVGGVIAPAGLWIAGTAAPARALEADARRAFIGRGSVVRVLALSWFGAIVLETIRVVGASPPIDLRPVVEVLRIGGLCGIGVLTVHLGGLAGLAGVPSARRHLDGVLVTGIIGIVGTVLLQAATASGAPPLAIAVPLLLLGPGLLFVAVILLAVGLIGLIQALGDARDGRPPSARLRPVRDR